LKQAFELGALQGLRWTRDVGEIPDIEEVRPEARAFPRAALRGKRNVLSLFSARFYGIADVIHIHDAAADHVTLVDLDTECLEAMQRIYPREWMYVNADYSDFRRQAAKSAI
jgi:hypothetical protein